MRRNANPELTGEAEDTQRQAEEELELLREQITAQKELIESLQAQQPQTVQGKDMSPERKAVQQELRRLSMERARYLKRQVDWIAAGRKGMPPHYLTKISLAEDGSEAPIDPATGKSVVPEGMVPVWVSCYDGQGRDSADPTQVRQRKRVGYETACFADGREVRDTGLGILMYASPKNAALWAELGMRAGAVNPADYCAAQMENLAEEANKAAGTDVMRVKREDVRQWSKMSSPLDDPDPHHDNPLYSS